MKPITIDIDIGRVEAIERLHPLDFNLNLLESRIKIAKKILQSSAGRWITVRGRPIFVRIKPNHTARAMAKEKVMLDYINKNKDNILKMNKAELDALMNNEMKSMAIVFDKKYKAPLTPEKRKVWDAIGKPELWKKVIK